MFVPSQISTAVGGMKFQGVPHSTITFAAQLMAGGVVSTTVSVWLQKDTFEQPSAADQVRVMLKRLGQRGTLAFVTVLTMVTTTFVPSQTSTAEGGVNAKGWLHSTI